MDECWRICSPMFFKQSHPPPMLLAWNKQNKYWYSVGFSLDTVTGNFILPPSPCTSDMKTYLAHMAPWLQNQEREPKKTVWRCSPMESELRFIYFLLRVHGLCSEKVKTVNSKSVKKLQTFLILQAPDSSICRHCNRMEYCTVYTYFIQAANLYACKPGFSLKC